MAGANESPAPSERRCTQIVFDVDRHGVHRLPCVLVADHWGRCSSTNDCPDAGSIDDEYAYNIDTEKYDRRAIRVKCPGCGRIGSPLCSHKTERLRGEWRWVGLDHKQPEVDFRTTCRCGQTYTFTTYTPQ